MGVKFRVRFDFGFFYLYTTVEMVIMMDKIKRPMDLSCNPDERECECGNDEFYEVGCSDHQTIYECTKCGATLYAWIKMAGILMVEEVLKKANNLISREQLKKKLPTKIMHQTLNVILKYLEDSGKILDGRKGILWIYNPSPKLDKAIKEGVEL